MQKSKEINRLVLQKSKEINSCLAEFAIYEGATAQCS